MEEQTVERKKVILSGIQPSGRLHIGNLVGAIRNWAMMQDEFECYFTIVDQHSITVRQKPADLRKWSLDLTALLVACGLDSERCALFIQSHIPAHAQLFWVLSCYAQKGELERMTQFKEKSKKNPDNINLGLLAYPVLQAADILVYNADLVPVGQDQKQHLELTRNIAERFNFYHPGTFVIPEPYIPPVGAKIMSLQEPTKKMSKSDENDKGSIFVADSADEVRGKIKRAVTDSGSEVKFSADKPGVSNLMTLYNIATGKTMAGIEAEFEGRGYGDFKPAVGEAVAEFLRPIRERYNAIRSDKTLLEKILREGADRANARASRTLRKVYKKVGFVEG